MRKFLFTAILWTIIGLLLACQDDALKYTKQWQGREILFPSNTVFTKYAKDTIDFNIEGKCKLLIYADSVGCSSCKLKLQEWKTFMSEFSDTDSVAFIFVVHPKSQDAITVLLKSNLFRHPTFIDYNDDTNRINHFPNDFLYQTFLLDRNNRVILVGNPILTPSLKPLYKRILLGSQM